VKNVKDAIQHIRDNMDMMRAAIEEREATQEKFLNDLTAMDRLKIAGLRENPLKTIKPSAVDPVKEGDGAAGSLLSVAEAGEKVRSEVDVPVESGIVEGARDGEADWELLEEDFGADLSGNREEEVDELADWDDDDDDDDDEFLEAGPTRVVDDQETKTRPGTAKKKQDIDRLKDDDDDDDDDDIDYGIVR